MAEHAYVRLGSARYDAPTQAYECPACRGIFSPTKSSQVYCSLDCGRRTRRGSKPLQEWPHQCANCHQAFHSTKEKAQYCSGKCKLAKWRVLNPESVSASRIKERAKPKKKQPEKLLSAYYVGNCSQCHQPWANRSPWLVCSACKKAAYRDAQTAVSRAKHAAQAKVISCSGCDVSFSPVYGYSHCTLCDPCSEHRQAEAKKAAKDRRKAVIRGATTGGVVYRTRVFERDGWLCQLCGVQTPKALMGTLERNAPELDHIVAVSKGGAHSYENTQCLCRGCNGIKSDRPMDEVATGIQARGGGGSRVRGLLPAHRPVPSPILNV